MIGFDAIKSDLLSAYQNQKLHHAILLHGKKGIGKASFSKQFVSELLNDQSIAHPDLLIVEKAENKKEITVDKIRKIANFAHQTSAVSDNKFIIINSACELNKSAANALLKILEEPRPNNFLILISHNLNHLLPTIRSRCQIIKTPDLSANDFAEVLQQNNLNFSQNDLCFLAEINDNSPADAISFGVELVRFYELFLRSLCNKKLSEEILKQISDKNFPFFIFEKSCEFFFNRLIKRFNIAEMNFYFEEEKLFLSLINKSSLNKILEKSQNSLSLLHKTTRFHLDKKLTLINIFNQICYE